MSNTNKMNTNIMKIIKITNKIKDNLIRQNNKNNKMKKKLFYRAI